MKSIMLNQNNDTFINFYILVSNLSYEQKKVINKIVKEHKNCKINFIDMGNQFKEFNLPFNIWTTANYYRIKLPELLPDIKKIIYFDSDTLIYKDLSKLYNYDIEGKYNNQPTNLITHKKNGYFTPEYVVIGFCNKKEIYSYYSDVKLHIN